MNRRTNSTVLFSVLMLLPLLFSTPSTAADNIDVVESETGFYYTIQKGDTLWDLSKHFNDSPWLWPELWEENDQISNPHWIFPGERIRLYQKSGSQTITKTEPIQPIVVTPVKPVEGKKAAAPFFVYSSIDRVGFIRKPPVPPSGNIFEVQGRKVLISEGDIVYIRPAGDTAQGVLIPGSRHTVFKYMEPTDERDSIETIGTQHYILGIVEVTKKEQDMVMAKVLKSFRPIRVDDMLMPFSQRHVGQQYSIYNKQKVVLEKNEISSKSLPPVDFGTLLVLHTEQTTSTVIITSTAKVIFPEERFRTPIN
ncbi:MAG: LysM peptidoglycan-binding domain-containing protein [Desulfosarcina sp.]|nr:LysM peptidoglycan-binding domain-containing protein [Desulfosarcina sp.]MBC2766534.1 LysM peptidoglycan-binding domain-containing protein [Desulfosarcina sp.]